MGEPWPGFPTSPWIRQWSYKGKEMKEKERKGNERKSIHIALFWPRRYTQSAKAWITVLPANNTMPAFHQSAFTRWHHHSN